MSESARPLRVAIVSHSSLTGAETLLLRLWQALDRRRVEATIVLPEEGPLRPLLAAQGAPTAIVSTRWWLPATHWNPTQFLDQMRGLEARADALADWLAANGIDLVHTNTVVTLEGALAAARLALPHLWHSRGLLYEEFPPPYFATPRLAHFPLDRLTDLVACVSQAVARQVRGYCRRPAVQVVHDGFDLAALKSLEPLSAEQFRARFALSERARTIACVGGVQRRKAQVDLVQALAALPPHLSDSVVVLCGVEADAEYAALLRREISRLRLGERVRFAGHLADLARCLPRFDLLVHPAHSEGFGLAILEAMALGCPVVATRSGGPEEILEDGVSGVLVPPADIPALSRAMATLLGEPKKAAALAAGARLRAALFELGATGEQMEAAYRQAVMLHREAGTGAHRLRAAAAETFARRLLARARALEVGSLPQRRRHRGLSRPG